MNRRQEPTESVENDPKATKDSFVVRLGGSRTRPPKRLRPLRSATLTEPRDQEAQIRGVLNRQGLMRGVQYWTRDPKEVPNQIDTFIGS